MTIVMKIAGLAAGSVTAASVVWAIAGGPTTGTSQVPPACTEGVCACVGSDATLREIAPGQACPAGQQLLELAAAEPDLPDDWGTDPAARGPADQGALSRLERRLAALEQRPLFEVVTADDDPIFRVTSTGAFLYNQGGESLVALRASEDGGWVTTRSTSGAIAVSLGATGLRSGIRISELGATRLDVGKQAQGNYALRFPSPVGQAVAGIGESRAGSGAVVVGDRAGQMRVSMTVSDTGVGAIGVYNGAATAVLSMTEGATRGGLVAIGDAAGDPMVKMGVQDDRYGIVLTGPADLGPYIPSSGLPGSYLLGCAGGAACGPKGGQE